MMIVTLCSLVSLSFYWETKVDHGKTQHACYHGHIMMLYQLVVVYRHFIQVKVAIPQFRIYSVTSKIPNLT